MSSNGIEVQRLSGALGAEIAGVDLSRELDDDTFAAIHQAFLDHQVIFFRDQTIEPGDFSRFARRFGELNPHRYLKGMDGHPDVLRIVREPDDPHVFAEGWHADVTYQECPVLGAMLYAVEVPEVGADTVFSSQYLAYEALSTGFREALEGLRAVHGSARVYSPGEVDRLSYPDQLKVDIEVARAAQTTHPVVRTHPETGRKALFVNDHYALRLVGMDDAESAALLGFLFRHAIREEFTCRFRWTPGALAFWDNRCTLHTPVDDYFGKRREMHRITIVGDRPV